MPNLKFIKYGGIIILVLAMFFVVKDYVELRQAVPQLEQQLDEKKKEYDDFVQAITAEQIANSINQEQRQTIDQNYNTVIDKLNSYRNREQEAIQNPQITESVANDTFLDFQKRMQCATGGVCEK